MTRRFGVSTTPVREAFVALQAEGLLLGDAHRGVVVFRPTRADLRENYEIRAALEALAATRRRERDARRRARPARARRGDARARRRDLRRPRVLRPRRRFHERIAEMARRPRLAALVRTLRGSARAYIQVLARTDANVHESLRGHEDMLAAIAARDPEAAAAALRAHLEANQRFIASLIPADDAP
jgi:DNA-binding GntR family transcriptional regulator